MPWWQASSNKLLNTSADDDAVEDDLDVEEESPDNVNIFSNQ
mgnify:CR=1 FL=1